MITECSDMKTCCVCFNRSLNLENVTSCKDGNGASWVTKLRFCVNTVVWSYNYLICKACTEHLDVVYHFHQLCLSSNERRQEALRTVSVKIEDADNENFVLYTDHLDARNNEAKQDKTDKGETNLLSKGKFIKAYENNPFQIVGKHENDTSKQIDLRFGNVNKTFNSDNTKRGVQRENCPLIADYGSDVSGDMNTNFETNLQTAIPTCANKLYKDDDAGELSDSHTEPIVESNKNIIKNSRASKYKRGSSRIRNVSRSKKTVRYQSKVTATKNSDEVDNETKKESMKVKAEVVEINELIDPADYGDSGDVKNGTINFKGLEKSEKVPNKTNRRNNMNFRCDLCGSMFIFYIKFMEHSVMVHNLDEKEVRPYACTYCPKRFNKHSTLKDHAKSHDPVRNEMCSYCGKAFKTKRALTIHEKQHLDLREYQCPHCPKRFNTHKNRNTHIYILHSDPKTWKHECTICEKKFALKTTYIAHMRIHSDFKQFACHLCQKRFTDRTTLRNHLTSHSNVREHRCEECGNEYKNVKYLKIHLAKAHNIGNIKLPVRLKKHFCDMCPKAFFYKNKLLRHIYTHTGERPFPCSVCDRKFTDKSYAVQHMKTIHNIIPGKIEDSI